MQRLRENLSRKLFSIVSGLIFAIFSVFTFTSAPVLAAPEDQLAPITSETTENPEDPEAVGTATDPTTDENTGDQASCFDQVGEISWLVCPTSGFIANIVDTLYEAIEDFLVIKPLTSDQNSPIRIIWEYMRNLSNIVFVVFIIVIIYSQVTGIGISNYGIKRALPRIIVAAILINISFFICALAVDVSNVLGASIHGLYNSVAETVIQNGTINPAAHFSVSDLFTAIAGGVAIAGLTITSPLGPQLIFMLIPVLLGILVSVAIGLFTISLRQAVVSLLVMIAPLAFVAYFLPNTEKWYKKWVNIFSQMLVFYPMFALLFWAARLAGWALITSATSWLGVILGVAVQIAPLFLALSLMKMSGTVLGAVSGRLSQLGNRAIAPATAWSNSMRENRRQRYYARSKMPYARLQRYLDYRNELRNFDTENAKRLRAAQAIDRTQRRIARGYDPTNFERDLRANRYARLAKEASIAELKARTTALDTSHVINQYGDFFKDKKSQALSSVGADQWIDYNRAEFTRISDEEGDFDFLVDKYIDAMYKGEDSWQYKRYLTSAAGKRGTTGVMGQLIAKAAAVEQRKRRDDSILLAKFGYDKRSQRNMMAGYYVDDDGWATDKNGERLRDKTTGKLLESRPGELLATDPSKLQLWDTVDENGRPYYNWKDKDGNFLMRIYKDDSAFTKEVLSNYDITIGDPINDVYAILAGNKDGTVTNRDGSPLYVVDEQGNPLLDKDGEPIKNSIGLGKYSTTIGHAFVAARYKENAAYAGPMAAQSIGQGHIKNYVHLNVERLDNLTKSTKPGNFNTQNPAEINQLAYLMDPDNWPVAFAKEFLEGRVNVNGNPLKGTDENGKEVAPDQATYEDKMRTIKKKYLFPAAAKMTSMMSRITPQTLDNQKPGAADAMQKLAESLQKWHAMALAEGLPASVGDKVDMSDATVPNIQTPFLQQSSFANTSKRIGDQLTTLDNQGRITPVRSRTNNNSNDGLRANEYGENARVIAQYVYNNCSTDGSTPDDFFNQLYDALMNTHNPFFHQAAEHIREHSASFVGDDIHTAYEEACEILDATLYD